MFECRGIALQIVISNGLSLGGKPIFLCMKGSKTMSQLDQIRTKINDIDEKMAALFEERMHMSEQVAAFKRERGLSVRDAERERELIARSAACIGDEAVGSYYAQFLRKVIDLSCAYQTRLMEGMQVAYCGVEGAYAYIAARRMFPQARLVSYPTSPRRTTPWSAARLTASSSRSKTATPARSAR